MICAICGCKNVWGQLWDPFLNWAEAVWSQVSEEKKILEIRQEMAELRQDKVLVISFHDRMTSNFDKFSIFMEKKVANKTRDDFLPLPSVFYDKIRKTAARGSYSKKTFGCQNLKRIFDLLKQFFRPRPLIKVERSL